MIGLASAASIIAACFCVVLGVAGEIGVFAIGDRCRFVFSSTVPFISVRAVFRRLVVPAAASARCFARATRLRSKRSATRRLLSASRRRFSSSAKIIRRCMSKLLVLTERIRFHSAAS
uniref:Putative secreted protein n=1 Tax=Anopheles darlingi TaxID=43151 RepID=A0A2M4DER6_ANODA